MRTFKIMSNSTYILIIITKFVTVAIFFRLAHLPQFFGIQFMNSWYVRINSFGAKYILSKFVHHPHTVFFLLNAMLWIQSKASHIDLFRKKKWIIHVMLWGRPFLICCNTCMCCYKKKTIENYESINWYICKLINGLY